jgi:4-amino-4-deoxy-L-arabinose transferase-like glycosyltransferase
VPSRREWVVLLAVAAAARVLVGGVLLADWPITSDAARYVNEAIELAHSFERREAYYFPAGMIWALAAAYTLLGSSTAVTRAVTILLSLLAVPCVVRLTRELSTDPRAPRIAGWIAALYPPSLLSSGYPGSQSLAYPTFVAAAMLFLSAWRLRSSARAAAAGAVLGVFSITRSSAFTVVFALAALWCVRLYLDRREGDGDVRAKLGIAAAALAAWIAVISPVIVHHWRLGEGITLATCDAWNVFAGNNKYTPLYRTGYLAHKHLSKFPPQVTQYLAEFEYRPVDARGAMRREVLEYVREHPWTTALRTVNRARAFWGFDHANSALIQKGLGLSELQLGGLLLLEAGGYAAVAVLALLAAFIGRDRLRAGPAGFVLLMIGSYQLAFMLAFAHSNFHVPVMPLLMPLAAVSVAKLAEDRGAALLGSRGAWLALAAFAAVQIEYGYFALLYR